MSAFEHDGQGNWTGQCFNKVMNWSSGTNGSALGFGDTGVSFPAFKCDTVATADLSPQKHFFLDLDGDGRLDHLQADPLGTEPGQWQWQLNQEGKTMSALSPLPLPPIGSACPTYAVDLGGDGRGQILSQVTVKDNNPPVMNPPISPNDPLGNTDCGGAVTMTYSSRTNSWIVDQDMDGHLPKLPSGLAAVLARGETQPVFGDFNGDGLQDVLEPEPTATGGKLWLRWNTGNGFGPRVALANTSWLVMDPNPVWGTQTKLSYRMSVVDINRDGRADLLVLHEKPTAGITLLLSKGDGTFETSELVDDQVTGPEDPGLQTFEGFPTTRLGDFNNDGLIDIVRVKQTKAGPSGTYGDTAYGKLQILQQIPRDVAPDRIEGVWDEGTVWPRYSVTYAMQESDKPEAVTPCSYPQHCMRREFPVVRALTARDMVVDPASAWDAFAAGHTLYYSYEDMVSDMRGSGILGFRKIREWDPQQIRETVTECDNRIQVDGKYYPGAFTPQRVTTTIPIANAKTPQTPPVLPREGNKPVPVNARVMRADYKHQLKQTHQGQTYVVQPLGWTSKEWEQSVMIVASVTNPADPTSEHIFGIVEPEKPLRVRHSSTLSIDDFGNVTGTREYTEGGTSKEVLATYENRTSGTNPVTGSPRWQIGLLKQSMTAQGNSQTLSARGVGYDYDDNGQLSTIYRQNFATANQPAVLPKPVTIGTTKLTRDKFGLVTGAVTQALGPDGKPATRETRLEYDAWPGAPNERIFTSQVWQPYEPLQWQPSAWTLVHPAYGVEIATSDVNGVKVSNQYDDQGRRIGSQADGSAPVTINYAGRVDSYGGFSGMQITASSNGQQAQVITDGGGRTLLTTHRAFDGTTTKEQRVYDRLGRLQSASRPYQGASSSYSSKYTYDGLNRLLQTIEPDSTAAKPVISTSTPGFFTTQTTDPSGHQHQETRDVDGRVIASEDWLAAHNVWVGTLYHYALFDQVDTVTDANGNVMTTQYDSLGRAMQTQDPDAGMMQLDYDDFDDLLHSTHQDPTHQEPDEVTTYAYDALGRQIGQNTNLDGDTTLTWDSAANGIGQLASAVSRDKVITNYHYDSYGRATGIDEIIDGEAYPLAISYDNQGRILQLSYPPVGASPVPGMTLQYHYNAFDYLSELDYETGGVGSTPGLPLSPLWTITARNLDDALSQAAFGQNKVQLQNQYLPASGRLQRITATPTISSGPGFFDVSYTYELNGAVSSRTDPLNARAETYFHDTLDRLITWSLATCAQAPCMPAATDLPRSIGYDYDFTGNLMQVTQILPSQPSVPTVLESNTYGTTANATGGPHALTAHQVGGTTTSYSYDSHGRQKIGGGRTLTYTAFDLPKTVTVNGDTSNVIYDAFGQRARTQSALNGTVVSVGGVYERRTTPLGAVAHVFEVPGVAQITASEASGATTTNYLLTDALGSVGAVVDGSASQAQLTNQFFYEPFGKLIAANGSAPVTLPTSLIEGFTGQEHDPSWGLINFQARMYDPNLKRMLTLDPHVTNPLDGQNLNGYSYVRNSPLNLVDPSGKDFESFSGSGFNQILPPGGAFYPTETGWQYGGVDADGINWVIGLTGGPKDYLLGGPGAPAQSDGQNYIAAMRCPSGCHFGHTYGDRRLNSDPSTDAGVALVSALSAGGVIYAGGSAVAAGWGLWTAAGSTIAPILAGGGAGARAIVLLDGIISGEAGLPAAAGAIGGAVSVGGQAIKRYSITNGVNPKGYERNCVECVIIGLRRLKGLVAGVAGNSESKDKVQVRELLKQHFGDFTEILPYGMSDVVETMKTRGSGALAMLAEISGPRGAEKLGHATAVVNDAGIIRFLDFQKDVAGKYGSITNNLALSEEGKIVTYILWLIP